MDMYIFQRAMYMADTVEAYVTFGGGEPTVHPKFRKMVAWALRHLGAVEAGGSWYPPAHGSDRIPFIVTNGRRKRSALWLLSLMQQGVLQCALSQDIWHDPIDAEVVTAFTRYARSLNYSTGFASVFRKADAHPLVNAGRAKTLDWAKELDPCPVGGPVVQPNGAIYSCGCDDAPQIGHVLSSEVWDVWPCGCYREAEEEVPV